MKRILAAMLALIIALSLSACGGKGGGKTTKDENLIAIGDYQVLYKGCEIMPGYSGDDAVVASFDFTNNSKETASFAWSVFYTATQGGGELEPATIFVDEDSLDTLMDAEFEDVEAGATIEINIAFSLLNLTDDVVIDFSDLTDKHKDTLTIKLPEKAASQAAGTSKPVSSKASEVSKSPEPAAELSSYQQYWDGDWYGWLIISNAAEAYADMIDSCTDCAVSITVNDDNTGHMTIQYLDGDGIGEVDVSFGAGTTAGGCMTSESGDILEFPVSHADWTVDPGASTVSSLEHMIQIDGTIYDEDDDWFDYNLFLRPWGMKWEDVRSADTSAMLYDDMMPLEYDSWYLPAVNSGADMAEAMGGSFSAEPEQQPSADGDYGMSNADADGVTSLDILVATGKYVDEHRTDVTYDDVYCMMGYIDGLAMTDSAN